MFFLKQNYLKKQNNLNLEDLLPAPEKVVGFEGAHKKLHLLTILSDKSLLCHIAFEIVTC